MAAIWTRTLGVATVAYSVAIMIDPRLLERPCRLDEANGRSSPATRLLIRALGARDVAIGAAMALAPTGRGRTVATACRVSADCSDALLFGTLLPDQKARLKVAVFASAWAAVSAAAGFTDH